MSLFLAPIHQIMYDKIHYTDDLAVALAQRDAALCDRMENALPAPERAPLAEVIDTDNIHGWLKERVERAEARLAFAASALSDAGRMDEIRAVAYEAGRREDFSGTPEEAFRRYDARFLNGMPCDRVHTPVATESGFAWERHADVHAPYYAEHPGLYDEIVRAWWAGLLADAPYTYEENEHRRAVR